MKILNKLALSALLVVTSHSVSFAALPATVLHITGSTAFRATVDSAIVNYLIGNGATSVKAGYLASSGSSLTGANQSVFVATDGTNTTVVETNFTGSAQGIYDTIHSNTPTGQWIDGTNSAVTGALTAVGAAVAPSTITGGASLGASTPLVNAAPDATLSDVWQNSTLIPTPALTESIANGVAIQAFVVAATPLGGYASSVNAAIPVTAASGSTTLSVGGTAGALKAGFTISGTGLQLFTVITSVNVGAGTVTINQPTTAALSGAYVSVQYTGFSNITTNQAQALFQAGNILPLSQFTSTPTDGGNVAGVVGIGRSPDSGTREEFAAETGINNFSSTSQFNQYIPLDFNGSPVTSASTQIWNVVQVPATTLFGLSLAAGDGGYSTGSQVDAALENTTFLANPYDVYSGLTNPLAGAPAYTYGYYIFVSPLGISDAKKVIALGGEALAFNGYNYNSLSVQEGQYTLWSYEHLYQSSGISTTNATLTAGIGTQILTTDGVDSGDLIGNLVVKRHALNVDGSLVY